MAARTRSRKAWTSYINRPKAQNASGVVILFLFNTDLADWADAMRNVGHAIIQRIALTMKDDHCAYINWSAVYIQLFLINMHGNIQISLTNFYLMVLKEVHIISFCI